VLSAASLTAALDFFSNYTGLHKETSRWPVNRKRSRIMLIISHQLCQMLADLKKILSACSLAVILYHHHDRCSVIYD